MHYNFDSQKLMKLQDFKEWFQKKLIERNYSISEIDSPEIYKNAHYFHCLLISNGINITLTGSICQTYTTDENTQISIIILLMELKGAEKFICKECKKTILGNHPQTDHYGNTYCDQCADKVLDFCECCTERFPKNELTYDKYEEGIAYCEQCNEPQN